MVTNSTDWLRHAQKRHPDSLSRPQKRKRYNANELWRHQGEKTLRADMNEWQLPIRIISIKRSRLSIEDMIARLFIVCVVSLLLCDDVYGCIRAFEVR